MNMKKSLALRLTNAQVFFLIREPIQHNLQEKMDIEIYLNLETPPHTKKKELGHPKSIILMFILSETENPPEPTTATSSTKTTSSTSSLKTTISTSLWLALAIFRGVLTQSNDPRKWAADFDSRKRMTKTPCNHQINFIAQHYDRQILASTIPNTKKPQFI